jgi:hypothetical protein
MLMLMLMLYLLGCAEIQVIFVDMRWGVRDENSCDHLTWIECAMGINWCKTESTGIFFLSLQGVFVLLCPSIGIS